MSRYSLIAFDMDGTLLDSSKKVRQDSLDAIHEAVAAGKFVSLSTGRSLPELEDYLNVLSEVKYVIGASGAQIFTNPEGEIIYSGTLDYETVDELFRRTQDFDVMWHLHSDSRGYTQRNQVCHIEDYGMGSHRPMFERLAYKAENLPELYREQRFAVYKFNCYCRTPEIREELRSLLEDMPVALAYAETKSLEVSAPGISKASGLTKLCKLLSIPVSQSIAVGDGDNDLAILGEAGLAVAMGNANENVIKAADVVVPSNDEGGCAQAIRQYLL